MGSSAKIYIKEKSEQDLTADSYWEELGSGQICITTTFQYVYGYLTADRTYINQMVFRITEALIAGNLLFLSDCPGIEKYFRKDLDYVAFSSAKDLAFKIEYYSQNIKAADIIKESGHSRVTQLILSKTFWNEILGVDGEGVIYG